MTCQEIKSKGLGIDIETGSLQGSTSDMYTTLASVKVDVYSGNEKIYIKF